MSKRSFFFFFLFFFFLQLKKVTQFSIELISCDHLYRNIKLIQSYMSQI